MNERLKCGCIVDGYVLAPCEVHRRWGTTMKYPEARAWLDKRAFASHDQRAVNAVLSAIDKAVDVIDAIVSAVTAARDESTEPMLPALLEASDYAADLSKQLKEGREG